MAKYIGRKIDVGLGREATRGTGVAPTFGLPRTDFSVDEKVTKAVVQSSLGTIQDAHQTHVLTKWAEGDMGGEVRDQSFGLLMYALFGTLSTSAAVDSLYTHSFSLQDDSQHDTLTFTVVDPNTTERYENVALTSLELTQELEDILSYSAGFMGKTSKVAGDTVTYTDENKFTKKHLSIKLAANIAGLAAASPISIKSLNVTFNPNVVMDDVLGTAEPEDFLNQAFSIEGGFTLNYEDETYKNYMRDNTIRAMEIKWLNTDVTIGTAKNPELVFQFPTVHLFDWEPNNALEEIVTQSISFKALQDLTGGADMVSTADLKNSHDGSNY